MRQTGQYPQIFAADSLEIGQSISCDIRVYEREDFEVFPVQFAQLSYAFVFDVVIGQHQNPQKLQAKIGQAADTFQADLVPPQVDMRQKFQFGGDQFVHELIIKQNIIKVYFGDKPVVLRDELDDKLECQSGKMQILFQIQVY